MGLLCVGEQGPKHGFTIRAEAGGGLCCQFQQKKCHRERSDWPNLSHVQSPWDTGLSHLLTPVTGWVDSTVQPEPGVAITEIYHGPFRNGAWTPKPCCNLRKGQSAGNCSLVLLGNQTSNEGTSVDGELGGLF